MKAHTITGTSAPDSGRLYARVSVDLASKISSGQYPVGTRLPSERDLAKAYEVSRPTVREAIIALEVDGLVEVRVGSGVYVVNWTPVASEVGPTDIGPFELLEARRAIEGEACALAATGITDAELARLSGYVDELTFDNTAEAIVRFKAADKAFHLLIAEATRNSAMAAAVKTLWEATSRYPQTKLLGSKANAAGFQLRIEEHLAILNALRSRDSKRAREAMRSHLGWVMESLLHTTEVRELEQTRLRVQEQRQRYSNIP